MPIKWSALKVSEAIDEVEKHISQIYSPLEQARAVLEQARKIPNLPQYMDDRLRGLIIEIERATGGVFSHTGQPYKGSFARLIETAWQDIPEGAIEADRAREHYGSQLSPQGEKGGEKVER